MNRAGKTAFLTGILVFLYQFLFSQDKFWVGFKDKDNVAFNPYAYFDPLAIERRILHGIPLNDFTDRPVREDYVQAIRPLADTVGVVSRWFNGVFCWASEEQIAQIQALPFVLETVLFSSNLEFAQNNEVEIGSSYDLRILSAQTDRMGGTHFANKNIDGTGVRIAIFDAGFPNVDNAEEFEHIVLSNRIIETWDFVRGKGDVFGNSAHGTMVLSCIAGKHKNGRNIGLATGAEFLLARTERSLTEKMAEEENWLAAAEWADQMGAHIINSSLGYTHNRYFKEDMDGKTSLVSRAGNMAARKGILVVNAAGNEGTSKWKRIGCPADADSVLSVGGISPTTGFHVNFSSYGPTQDKRLKPNVCAFGIVFARGENGVATPSGTSFSSPLVAGFAACALQTNRKLKNMELFALLEKASDLYPYFDYAHGYGVPQASYFTTDLAPSPERTFSFEVKHDVLQVLVDPALIEEASAVVIADGTETSPVSEKSIFSTKPDLLFCHVENEKGYLDTYEVIKVFRTEAKEYYLPSVGKGKTIRVHYRGFTDEYKLE